MKKCLDNPSNLDVRIIQTKDCFFAQYNTLQIEIGIGLKGYDIQYTTKLTDQQCADSIKDIILECLDRKTCLKYVLSYEEDCE